MKNLLIFSLNSLEHWCKNGLRNREIELYKHLSKKNVSYRFLTFGTENDLKYSDLLEDIEIIPTLKLINSRFPKFHYVKSLFLPLKLKEIFKEVDIIKTHQIKGSLIACVAKILYKKKIIIRGGFERLSREIRLSNRKGIKNYIKYLSKYFRLYLFDIIAYKLADGIILTSDQDISFIIKCFKLKRKYKNNKIRHLHNYINVDLFKPLNLTKKDNHVLFIGKLTRRKNIFNLIKAFKDLKEFSLDIIGEGPYENLLRQECKKLGVNVNFLGIFPNSKIPEIINQYQIFILPSYWEGNPKVLLEAMSCGVACIGANIQGINNLIKHKQNGYLCENSSSSIKEAITTLYNDNRLREKIGKNARLFILDNCSLKYNVEEEYLLYKQILKLNN